MTTHKEYLKQIDELHVKAKEARAHEIQTAVEQIHALMAEHHLSVADLKLATKVKKSAAKEKTAAQYRDPENPGNTWSGRGRMPAWMKGQDKQKFRI